MASSPAPDLVALLAGPTPDPELLTRALTHRSWAAEHAGHEHNERLELLGDAVLELAVTDLLLAADPLADEGLTSRRRAALVRESSLAEVARGLGLGAELRLGRGERASGGADKDSLLADALEAVLGAVHLTSGYLEAAATVERLLGGRIAELLDGGADGVPSAQLDAKTALQERLAQRQLPPPEYRTSSAGPDHAPTFRVEVVVDGTVLGTGEGGSKKAASQAAAEQALRSGALG